MSNEVTNPQGSTSGFEDILRKYLNEGGDPASTPTAAPLNIRFGNDQISVKSTEELQSEVDRRLGVIAQAYQQEKSRYEAALAAATAAQQSVPVPQQVPQSSGGNDPVEFVQSLVNDPTKALEGALADKLSRLEKLERNMELQTFTLAHPLYGNPQIMQGLQKVCEQGGMPVTASNLEMAAAWAVKNNIIPDEAAFREQQRQAFLQQLQPQGPPAQQAPPQQGLPPGVSSNYAQYMAARPMAPPSTYGVQGNAGPSPSQLDQAVALAPQMSAADLKALIERAGGPTV